MKFYRRCAIMVLILASGCSKQEEAIQAVATAKAIEVSTAQQVMDGFVKSGLPVDKVRNVSASDDANQLLGRPHQYTSKIDFIDTRFPEGKLDEATNNIEVFANDEDARARRDYIDRVMRDMPMATQYLFLRKNVLVRINGALTPEAAKEYEDASAKLLAP